MINPISPKKYTSVDSKQTRRREAGSKRAQHSQGKEDKWKRKKILRPKAAAADKEETKRRQRGKKGETKRRWEFLYLKAMEDRWDKDKSSVPTQPQQGRQAGDKWETKENDPLEGSHKERTPRNKLKICCKDATLYKGARTPTVNCLEKG